MNKINTGAEGAGKVLSREIATPRQQRLNRVAQRIDATPGKAYVPSGLTTAEVRWHN